MVILDDLAEMFRLHRKICWLHNFACITVCHHLVPKAGVYVMGFTVHEKYIGKFRKIFNTRSQETVDVCLEMFGCLQAERIIEIRKLVFEQILCYT